MSEENVEILRALFAAFAERDLPTAQSLAHPELEIRPGLVGGLEGTVHRGIQGLADFAAEIDAAWVEFRLQPGEFRDLGDRVLILGHASGRGRESGISLSSPAGWLAEVRDGRVYRFESFLSHDATLEAAGLSE